ncbi:MAG: DUF6623 family protein [Potamolinea sp.]
MQLESGKKISTRLNKRHLLKYLGAGAVAGGIGLFAKEKAQAQGHTSAVPYVYMHGTSVQVEYTDRIESILRQGFYTTIVGKPNTFNWFHFAIPTLVITGKEKVKGVQVLFRTDSNNVVMKNVHLYIGTQKVSPKDNLNLYGSNGFGYITLNTPVSASGPVGISVGVSFGATANRSIQFLQASGQFEDLT